MTYCGITALCVASRGKNYDFCTDVYSNCKETFQRSAGQRTTCASASDDVLISGGRFKVGLCITISHRIIESDKAARNLVKSNLTSITGTVVIYYYLRYLLSTLIANS